MAVSTTEIEVPEATSVVVSDESLSAVLGDGRVISVPLHWYPRLLHATPEERNNWRLMGDGLGIHWPDLDEDVSVEGLLAGRASQEGPQSFQRWLEAKRAGRGVNLYEVSARQANANSPDKS